MAFEQVLNSRNNKSSARTTRLHDEVSISALKHNKGAPTVCARLASNLYDEARFNGQVNVFVDKMTYEVGIVASNPGTHKFHEHSGKNGSARILNISSVFESLNIDPQQIKQSIRIPATYDRRNSMIVFSLMEIATAPDKKVDARFTSVPRFSR